MMNLIVTSGGIETKHKIFHFEYAVLVHVLSKIQDSVRGMMVSEIAKNLCFYGVVDFNGVVFKLECVQ
jgi:hypothetical protein